MYIEESDFELNVQKKVADRTVDVFSFFNIDRAWSGESSNTILKLNVCVATYDRKTIRFYVMPERILYRFFLKYSIGICIEKSMLEQSVDRKGIEDCNRCLCKRKMIKYFTNQKLIHKIFDIRNF